MYIALVYVTGDVHKGIYIYTSPVYISHNILEGPITPGIYWTVSAPR